MKLPKAPKPAPKAGDEAVISRYTLNSLASSLIMMMIIIIGGLLAAGKLGAVGIIVTVLGVVYFIRS